MYLYSMKQLLFISAGKVFPEGAFAFLQFLRQQESFHVKGLFFSPLDYNGIYSASYVPGSDTYVRTKDKERQAVAEHKAIFARRCEQANIHFQLHENDEPWSKQLVSKESRFTDLVVVSGEAFYAELDAQEPNLFLHEAMRETESPILVVPENFSGFNEVGALNAESGAILSPGHGTLELGHHVAASFGWLGHPDPQNLAKARLHAIRSA